MASVNSEGEQRAGVTRKRRRLCGGRAAAAAVDWSLALLLLSPLCVLYWRGTWQLLDIHLLPDVELVRHPGGYASLLIGYGLTFLCNATQHPVGRYISDRSRRSLFLRVFVSRTFTLVFAFGLVNLWRGVWQLLDEYFTNSWFSGAGSALVGVWALASLRALRNIAAPPVVINVDRMDADYTSSPTMFQNVGLKQSTCFFLSDVAFSVLVVGSLVVFVWRGVWVVMDRLLYPHHPALSCWLSLGVGYLLVIAAYLLQGPAAALSRRIAFNFNRVLLEDLFYLLASSGAISVWRGVWLFADVYIYPDDREFSNWLTMAVGLVASLALGAGNTLLAKGVYLDGAAKDGSGCILSTQYLRKYFKEDLETVLRMDRLAVSKGQVVKLLRPEANNTSIQGAPDGEGPAEEQEQVRLALSVQVEVVVERETVL